MDAANSQTEILTRAAVSQIEASHARVIWIAAPAGSGKTTLARQIADESGHVTVWLQIEEAHRDIGLFLSALAKALGISIPRGDFPKPTPDDVVHSQSFCRRLLEGAIAAAGHGVLLIADDFHLLGADSEAAHALNQCMARLDRGLRLIVTSRTARNNAFGRVGSSGGILDVTYEMLRLDPAEMADLVARHLPDNPEPETVAKAILDASGGWILGARLLIELRKSRPGSHDVLPEADLESVAALLADEILRDIPPDELTILRKAAQLPDLPAELVDRVLGADGAEAILRRHAAHSLFISRRLDRRYSLHDLVRGALCGMDGPADGKDTAFLAAAADAFLDAGYDTEGLHVLRQAGDWPRLTQEIESRASGLAETGRLAFLGELVSAIPQDARNASPSLRYWYGVCLQQVDPTQARIELVAAYNDSRGQGKIGHEVRVWAAAIDAMWLEWTDCRLLDPLIDDVETLARRIETEGEGADMTVLARGAFAAMSIRRPEHPDFPHWEALNLKLFLSEWSRTETLKRGLQLMIYYTWGCGERAKAVLVRDRLRARLNDNVCPPTDHCIQYSVEGAFQNWFEPDLERVVAHAEEGLAAARETGLPFWDVPILNALLYKVLAAEDLPRARHYVEAVGACIAPSSRVHDIAIHCHVTSYLHWLEGADETALASGQTAFELALDSGFCLSPIYYGIGLAAVLHTSGDRKAAIKALARARHGARDQRSACMTFMALMKGADFCLDAGSKARVLRYLRPALAIAAEQNYATIPWVRKSRSADLLELARAHGIEPDAVGHLNGALGLVRSGQKDQTVDTAKPIELHTLGRIDILSNGVSRLTSPKMQRGPVGLLLHLIASGPGGLSPDQLIDRLWPDADEQSGRQRLKTTIYRTRQLLGDRDAIVTSGTRIALNAERTDVDAWAIDSRAGCDGKAGPSLSEAAGVAALYQGAFGEGLADDASLLIYGENVANILLATLARALSEPAEADDDGFLPILDAALSKLAPEGAGLEAIRDGFLKRGWASAFLRLEAGWKADLD